MDLIPTDRLDRGGTMAKKYKSPAAQKMADQRKAKPTPKDSKSFTKGSNPHHGASLGQSGQQRGKR
jgi:hypothetical protein